MASITPRYRALDRAIQRVPVPDVLSRAFDRFAHALVVRVIDTGRIEYRMGGEAERFSRTVSAADTNDPNAARPAVPDIFFDLRHTDALAIHWERADTQPDGTIDVAVWVETDRLGSDGKSIWLRWYDTAGALRQIPPGVEVIVRGTGHRPVFVEVTDVHPSVAGNLSLYATGA